MTSQHSQQQALVQAPSPALIRQEAEGGLLLIQGLVRSCQGVLACHCSAGRRCAALL